MVNPFSYVQFTEDTVRQPAPSGRKGGSEWVTRVERVDPSHANGPAAFVGATRSAATKSIDRYTSAVAMRNVTFVHAEDEGRQKRSHEANGYNDDDDDDLLTVPRSERAEAGCDSGEGRLPCGQWRS